MGIIVSDLDLCPCGAYWQTSGYCCNGHPRRYNFKVHLCSCGGEYTVNDDTWPSRKFCNKNCGQHVDLGNDECWHTREEIERNWRFL